MKIVQGAECESTKVGGLGGSPFSIGARYEELSFNAHCNEHIRKMDTNGDLVISEQEARAYYGSIDSFMIKKK